MREPSDDKSTGTTPEAPGELVPQPAAQLPWSSRLDPPDAGVQAKLARLLQGPSPRAVLTTIERGDPLGVEGRAVERVKKRALLVEVPRVVVKALANIAFQARRYRGQMLLETWLGDRVDEALNDTLLEAQEEDALGLPSNDALEAHMHLAQALGTEVGLVRRLCIVFNGLPARVRRVFFELHMLGKSIDECVAAGHGTREEVERRYRCALRSMALLRPVDIDPTDGELEDE